MQRHFIKAVLLSNLLLMGSSVAWADVQNLDYSVRAVEVTGMGANAEAAMAQAEITAIEQVIATLVQTEAEKASYQRLRDTLLQQRPQWLEIDKVLGKGTTEDGGRYYKVAFKVKVADIRQALIKAQIIKATQEISRELNFPTIMAYYRDPKFEGDYALWSVGRVNSYLVNQQFKVVDAKIMANLRKDDQVVAQSAGKNDRLGQAIALKAQADIYMSVEISPKIAGRSGAYTYVMTPVQVHAYESSSGIPFITKTYQRLDRQGQPEALAIKGSIDVSTKAVIEEAVAGVMPQITEDLLRHWKGNIVKGKQFKLVFSGLSNSKIAGLEALLRQACPNFTAEGKGQYVVRYQGVLGDLADALEESGESLGLGIQQFDLGTAYFEVK